MIVNEALHMFSPKDCVRNSDWKKVLPKGVVIKKLTCKECGKEVAFIWDENGKEKMFIHNTFIRFKDDIERKYDVYI